MAYEIIKKDDRRDPKWAYGCGTKENWNNPTIATFFMDVMDPRLTPDQVKEGRAMFEGAFESMLSGVKLPPEVENSGEWREYHAPGCIEEPDAPPVRLRVRVPKERKSDRLPAILYIFAAGMGGKPEYFDGEVAGYCKDLGCVVVAPQYRFHPENKQPAQLNDMHATYQWMIDHADEIGIDSDCIILAGYSIGAQMALGLAQRLKRYGITPRGIEALFPPVDDRGTGPSDYITFGGENLGFEEVHVTWLSFLGLDRIALSSLSPEIMPNHASVEELKGMPPIFLHASESDPNRDGILAYASKLYEAGVMCSLHAWPGTNHASFYSGPPYELKNRYFAEVTQNISDMMQNDFRRPWNK